MGDGVERDGAVATDRHRVELEQRESASEEELPGTSRQSGHGGEVEGLASAASHERRRPTE